MATVDEHPREDGQAVPAAAFPETETQDPSGWGAKIHSVRFRVVAAMLGMMLAGLMTAGLVTFVVQFQEADARLDQALLDKANSVVKIVQTKKKTSGDYANRTYISALHEAAEDIEPRSNEVMAGIVDGRVAWTVEGNGDKALLEDSMLADAAELRNPAGASFGELDADGRPLRTVVVPMRGVTGTFFLVGRDLERTEQVAKMQRPGGPHAAQQALTHDGRPSVTDYNLVPRAQAD